MVVGASCGFGCGPRRPPRGCEVMALLLLQGRGASGSCLMQRARESAALGRVRGAVLVRLCAARLSTGPAKFIFWHLAS